MPICVTALCGRVSVQAQAGSAPAAIIPKEAVPIDPKQERHISMQSAKSPETAATSAQKKNGKKKKNKPRRSIFGTIMRFIGCLLCVCVMAASAGAVLLSLYVVQVTEDPDGKLDLDEQKLKQTSIVYDRDGNEVNTFAGENNRIWREISAMPENLQNAVIAVEDKDFRSEPGINVKSALLHRRNPSPWPRANRPPKRSPVLPATLILTTLCLRMSPRQSWSRKAAPVPKHRIRSSPMACASTLPWTRKHSLAWSRSC